MDGFITRRRDMRVTFVVDMGEAMFGFLTLNDARAFAEEHGTDLGSIRKLRPDEADAFAEMFEELE
jgi:hypothetical protein